MLKKPTPADFEISDKRVWHRPTDERYFPHPDKPADGQWQDGHGKAAAEYDQDEVRQMGRSLWVKKVATRKRKR